MSDDEELRAALLKNPDKLTEAVRTHLAEAKGNEAKSTVVAAAIRLLNETAFKERVAQDCTNLLVSELHRFPGPALVGLVDVVVGVVRGGHAVQSWKAFDLLPPMLSAIEGLPDAIATETSEITGAEYKSKIVSVLCDERWERKAVLPLATMFRDVHLSLSELKKVIGKVIDQLRGADLQELPGLIYQLLLLSRKGHKRLVVQGIVETFDKLDEDAKASEQANSREDSIQAVVVPPDKLRYVEGTVILHVSFAVKQDKDLGRQYLKYVKTEPDAWSPFSLAILLAIARIQRFKEDALGLLRSAVVSGFMEFNCNISLWNELMTTSLPPARRIDQMIANDVVRHSAFGWDDVVYSLAEFGFCLIDTIGRRGKSMGREAVTFGVRILGDLFKAHDSVRRTILERVFSSVISRSEVTDSYVTMLEHLVADRPQQMLAQQTQVQEVINYLSFLPSDAASGLVHAVLPLTVLSSGFHDHVILVLRKAMFNREADSRVAAVQGFIELLKSKNDSAGSSQLLRAEDEAVCLEILGHLRRCLTQQFPVRCALYGGLRDLVRTNRNISEDVFELLIPHLATYIEDPSNAAPLDLDSCLQISGPVPVLLEALPQLLRTCGDAICFVLRRAAQPTYDDDEEGVDLPAFKQLMGMMDSLVSRLASSDLEDFELDKTSEWNMADERGAINTARGLVLLGSLEAMMQFAASRCLANKPGEGVSAAALKVCLTLHDKHCDLASLCGAAMKASKSKKKGTTTKIDESLKLIQDADIMNFPTLHVLLRAAFSPAEDVNYSLVNFLTKKLSDKLERMSHDRNKTTEQAPSGDTLGKICELIFQQLAPCAEQHQPPAQTGGKKVLSTLHVVTLCYVATVRHFHLTGPAAMCSLLEKIDKGNTSGQVSVVQHHLKLLEALMRSYLRHKAFKECLLLVEAYGIVAQPLSSEQSSAHCASIKHLCIEQHFEDAHIARSFFELLLSILPRNDRDDTVYLLACDLKVLGDEGDPEEVKFNMINDSTFNAVMAAVLESFITLAEECDWLLGRLVAMVVRSDISEDDVHVPSAYKDCFDALVTRILSACQSISVLCTVCKDGQNVFLLMKSLTRLYKSILGVTKHVAATRLPPSKRFQSLAGESAAMTERAYEFFLYYASSNEEASKASLAKQARLMPSLVFAIEQHEAALIKLAKQTDCINLIKRMKRSASRDFKISGDMIKRKLQEDDESDSDGDQENQGSDDGRKRKREADDSDGEHSVQRKRRKGRA